jgi:GNAT superfamily N-acetyltransferase
MMLRPAHAADIADAAALVARAYSDSFAEVLEPETLAEFDAAYFRRRFALDWQRLLLAENAGEIVGLLLVTEQHIDMLFVAAFARGKGVGAALLDAASSGGARSLESFAANARALRFYQTRGWSIVSRYRRAFAGREREFVRLELTGKG